MATPQTYKVSLRQCVADNISLVIHKTYSSCFKESCLKAVNENSDLDEKLNKTVEIAHMSKCNKLGTNAFRGTQSQRNSIENLRSPRKTLLPCKEFCFRNRKQSITILTWTSSQSCRSRTIKERT